MKLILLDIDGVMNRKRAFENGYYGIEPVPAHLLSTLLRLTGSRLVIHSAWRYLVLTGSMTMDGFANLMSSHGVQVWDEAGSHRIEAVTRFDEGEGSIEDRVRQIEQIVAEIRPETWVALDDLPLHLSKSNFIETDSAKGLTAEDFLRALEILGRVPEDHAT